jgi:hypothetical protein
MERTALLACALLLSALVAVVADCPPEGFDSVPGLDLKKFISAPWFTLQQVLQQYVAVQQLRTTVL